MRPAPLPPRTVSSWGYARSLPIAFEANAGQFADEVSFLAHGRDADLLLGEGVSLVVRSKRADGSACTATIGLVLPPHTRPVGEHVLPTRNNYFLGNDPGRWRSDVPSYAYVTYPAKAVDGVSVRFHGSDDGRLEYDLSVPARSELSALSIEIRGGDVRIAHGAVVVETPCGVVTQQPPAVFQGSSRRPLHAVYRMRGRDRVGFDVDARGAEGDILIDPTLVFSTSMAGADSSLAIANDVTGEVYVAGSTSQTSFPVTNPYQPSLAGSTDVWLAKLAADGSSLVYATYLGGVGADTPRAIALDSSEDVYLVGATGSPNFPIVNPFQAKYAQSFVAKIAPAGNSLVYSSFLGGSKFDAAIALAVDAAGAAYVGGETASSDFPVTAGAFQTTFSAATAAGFVTKVDANGGVLDYATFLSGSNWDYVQGIAVDSGGRADVTGTTMSSNFPTRNAAQPAYGGFTDGFVTQLSVDGSSIGYSTYLGGSQQDYGTSISVDAAGDAYVVGPTQSSDFPVKSPYQSTLAGSSDAFVTKYDASGTVVASTYLGGSGSEGATAVAVSPGGDVFVLGQTSSTDFPVKKAFQSSLAGGADCYVSRFDGSLSSLVSSTYLGGAWGATPYGLSVDSASTVYLTGAAQSGDFPFRNALYTTGSVFITKMGTLTISPAAVTLAPKQSQTFTASDGSGSGYAFSLISGSSGGSITPNGAYTAGPKANVTDIVQLTDSAGTSATATVTVGPGVTIVPPAPSTPPNGTISFSANGGTGSGYLWSLLGNNSGGTIGSGTGKYTAGSTANVVDTILVVDALGNSATAAIVVGSGVSIVPAAPSVPPKGSIAFSATGGSGLGYVWSLSKNASGATIDATSGAYEAGALGKTVDTVRVDDSFGSSAFVNVSVGGGIAIDPAAPKAPPRGSVQLAAVGGAGSGYVWHLDTNASGGSLDATSGLYVAGAKGNVTDDVSVADPLGNAATVAVTVGPGIEVSPLSAAVAPHESVTFVATGGDGHDYHWSLSSAPSGGTIDADSGVYTAGTGEGADHVHVGDPLGNEGQALALVGPVDAGADGGAAVSASGGCSCRSAPRSQRAGGAATVFGLLGALLLRRRSRRRA